MYWFRRARRSKVWLFGISILVLVGMWFERFTIIVEGLLRDQLPSSWGHYTPSIVDLGILFGTLGFFGFLFLLFVRFMPFIPVSELKEEEHA